jgi:hypothetical protein
LGSESISIQPRHGRLPVPVRHTSIKGQQDQYVKSDPISRRRLINEPQAVSRKMIAAQKKTPGREARGFYCLSAPENFFIQAQ